MATLFAAEARDLRSVRLRARAPWGSSSMCTPNARRSSRWYEPHGQDPPPQPRRRRADAHGRLPRPPWRRPGANLTRGRHAAGSFPEKVFADETRQARRAVLSRSTTTTTAVPTRTRSTPAKHEWPQRSAPRDAEGRRVRLGSDPQAGADMWRYLLDVDLVSYVKTWDRPLDEPLQWLLERATCHAGQGVRCTHGPLLDVAAALAGRGYPGRRAARCSASGTRPPGERRGRTSSGSRRRRAVCERTTADPDLSGAGQRRGSGVLRRRHVDRAGERGDGAGASTGCIGRGRRLVLVTGRPVGPVRVLVGDRPRGISRAGPARVERRPVSSRLRGSPEPLFPRRARRHHRGGDGVHG